MEDNKLVCPWLPSTLVSDDGVRVMAFADCCGERCPYWGNGGGVMENLLQNFASGLWIVLGVYCFFGLRKRNKRFSELYDELKGEVERWND